MNTSKNDPDLALSLEIMSGWVDDFEDGSWALSQLPDLLVEGQAVQTIVPVLDKALQILLSHTVAIEQLAKYVEQLEAAAQRATQHDPTDGSQTLVSPKSRSSVPELRVSPAGGTPGRGFPVADLRGTTLRDAVSGDLTGLEGRARRLADRLAADAQLSAAYADAALTRTNHVARLRRLRSQLDDTIEALGGAQ